MTRAPRPSLFQSEASRSNHILARTMFNEMLRSGRTRVDMLDFVNCLLGLLSEAARPEGPVRPAVSIMVDPESGFPTRHALQELLLHELERSADEPGRAPVALLLLRLSLQRSLETDMLLLRHALRRDDVIVPLEKGRVAVVLHGPQSTREAVCIRIHARLEMNAQGRAGEAMALRLLEPGRSLRLLWLSLFRELQLPGHRRPPDG